MIRNLKDFLKYKVMTREGEIGALGDVYLDDFEWNVRYLVVDLEGNGQKRSVLLAPMVADLIDDRSKQIVVNLSRKQVLESPDIDLHRPVSRQHEERLYTYYGWPYYWSPGAGPFTPLMPGMPGEAMLPDATPRPEGLPATGAGDEAGMENSQDNPHLRSFQEIKGYNIQARDGGIGQLDSLLAEDESWAIPYLVVETSRWLTGRKVLIAPQYVRQMNWQEKRLDLDLSRETIENSPSYDPTNLLG